MDVHSPKKYVTIRFDSSPDGFTKKNINIRWPPLAYHNWCINLQIVLFTTLIYVFTWSSFSWGLPLVGMSTARIFWGLNFTMWGFIHVIDVYIYIIIWLVVSTPLKNMKVSWDYIPNIWKKKFQTSNQLYIPFGWISSVYTISCICLYTGSKKKKTQKKEQLVDFPVLVDEPMGK